MKHKTLLALLIGVAIFLSGCARTSTLYSNTFIKPSQPINELKVLYLENKLTFSNSNTPANFSDIGYTDLPELFRERVPIVFGLNGLGNEYATFQKRDFGQREAINAVKWTKHGDAYIPLLTIQVVDGSIVSGSKTPTTITLNLHANLIDPKNNNRLWTGQFKNAFTKPPVGRTGFDNEFTDYLLKTILEQMAKDGIILLKEGKATMPSAKK